MDIDLLILLPPYSDIPRQFFTDVVTIFDVGIVVMVLSQFDDFFNIGVSIKNNFENMEKVLLKNKS